jgi:hypothetical protein
MIHSADEDAAPFHWLETGQRPPKTLGLQIRATRTAVRIGARTFRLQPSIRPTGRVHTAARDTWIPFPRGPTTMY